MGYMVGEKRLQRVLRSMVVNGLVERLEGRFVFGSRVYRTVYRVREDVCPRYFLLNYASICGGRALVEVCCGVLAIFF